jgi:hypothetical protein
MAEFVMEARDIGLHVGHPCISQSPSSPGRARRRSQNRVARLAHALAPADRALACLDGAPELVVDDAQVFVRLDGDAPQAERTAEGTAAFSARFEDLEDDQRYTPVVRVLLDDGASETRSGPEFAVGSRRRRRLSRPYAATSRSTTSLAASRFRGRRALLGLGVCDADFNTLFLQHGFEAFALNNPVGTNRWYVHPANIPPS